VTSLADDSDRGLIAPVALESAGALVDRAVVDGQWAEKGLRQFVQRRIE
jgi:hypothetical protein